jgi:hypothetical protein
MLKTISAALLAVSVLAAPAMAAGAVDKTPAPVTKNVATIKAAEVKPIAKPVDKTAEAKPALKASVLNANAKMGRHHHRHVRHMRHHRRHMR